ncbi:MAG: insulinase family protein, partial [Chlamydiae bacterium]|nr:insulinase family protein [Chlamydiota bacterium]
MKKLLIFLFCFIASLSFCNETGYQKIEDQSNLTILNPFLANRKISKIQLSNGLKAYIISDKNADRSAAALAVNAGYWNDPLQYEGMAHFCEHMLFKGSKAYPSETEYFHFMYDNSANVNAFTSFDKTVYGFSIHNEIFKEALDRLSHFFIDPLFKEGEIAKELYAVDQEHSKNIENDGWRFFMILKELSSKDHPFSKFSTGTSETLSKIPPTELRKWYENYYNANNMALVVYSPLELNELTSLVMEKFEQVPNKPIESLSIPDTIFTEETKGHFIYIKPFADLQEISLMFELPKDFASDEDKSLELIAYTLQRGQSYSLLESLKKEQLAESVHVSVETLSQKHALLSIGIELTNQGIKNTDLVIQRCFEAINNLKQTGVPEYIYSEMKKMSELNYQYQPQIDAFEFVMHHASDLSDEDFSTYPRKTILPTSYNPKKISAILETLTPKMGRYFLACDPKKINITLEKKEKWMEAEYSIKEVAKEKLSSWENALNPNIKTPEINPFIPSKLELCPSTNDTATFDKPLKLYENEKGVLFFAKDNKYLTPEISWHFTIKDALFDLNPKTYALKDLYVKALFEKLQSTIFSAESAGLRVKFFTESFDFVLQIDGYSEKASYLLEEVLNQIKTFSMSESEFDTHKNSLTLDY